MVVLLVHQFPFLETLHFLACGSSSGIVNVYDLDNVLNTESVQPIPLKSYSNIVTPITGTSFHPSSQLLTFYSRDKETHFVLPIILPEKFTLIGLLSDHLLDVSLQCHSIVMVTLWLSLWDVLSKYIT